MFSNNYFKVGGSLPSEHPTYIERQADHDIYHTLIQREFCYVLNSRQMGKSSLKLRTMRTLTNDGFQCVEIDLGILSGATPDQWYGGLVAELWDELSLTSEIDDLQWWSLHSKLPPVQRFLRFIEDVLLINCTSDIIIFLDEVDNIINLDFRDLFLTLIRNCYERRAKNKQYCRLTFCLLGVATPSSLKIDRQLIPFGIGRAIQLTGFNLNEAKPLLRGLQDYFNQPEAILEDILYWTKGQPFLTQKICYLALKYHTSNQINIAQLIQQYIVENWEIQDEPEHLKTIRDRLLFNQENQSRLLTLYQRILDNQSIPIDGSEEQVELRLSGIVSIQEGNLLKVSNPIYLEVFNREWVADQLFAICPYQNALKSWLQSNRQDQSRLLRGEALAEAQHWSSKHNITDIQRDFLQQSEILAIKERIQAEKAQIIAKKLAQKKRLVRWQRLFILFSISMIAGFYLKSRQTNLSNINTLVQSSKALSASQQKLDALIAAIKAKQKLNKSFQVNQNLTEQVNTALQQSVYSIKEKNRLMGHKDHVYGVAVSEDGKLMATVATDKTLRLWQKDATGWQPYRVLRNHTGWVIDVAISPNGQTIATASRDRTVKLWNRDGKLLDTLQHDHPVTSVALQNQQVITGSENGEIKIWQAGELITTLTGHTAAVEGLAITSDNKIISASEDKTLKIWQGGELITTLTGHTEGVRTVAITSDNKIVSGSRDRTIKIWDSDGTVLANLTGHLAPIYSVAVNPLNDQIVSASADKTLKIWDSNGDEITTLQGHTNRVWDVAYTPDGSKIVSASWDKSVRIWQPNNNLIKILSGHQDVAIALDYNSRFIASASDDKTVKLWTHAGTLLKTFEQHTAEVYDVAIGDNFIASVGADQTLQIWHSNNDSVKTIKAHNAAIWAVDIDSSNNKIVTAGNDNLIKLWDVQGNLLLTLQGHQQKIWDVIFTPDNQRLISASEDNTVKVWSLEGKLQQNLQGHQDAVKTVISSGKQIISGSEDRTIKIWDLTGKLIDTLEGHQAAVKSVTMSPNQQYLASVDDDGKIILWQQNNQTWSHLQTLQGHDSSIWASVFSPDSQTLATAGEDAKVILWNLDNILQLNPLEYGCNWIQDYLHHSPEVTQPTVESCR
ncbi:MAG: AAA-like domain-containing protein [Cyanobacteria bacterium P01_A01_bin.83]